jgi:hypothetical protein
MTTNHAARSGFVVSCLECRDVIYHTHWIDLAESFADRHEDAHGHTTEVLDDGDHDG